MTNHINAHQILPIWDSYSGTARKRLADDSPPPHTAGFSASGCDPSARVLCFVAVSTLPDHQGPSIASSTVFRKQVRLLSSKPATPSCRESSGLQVPEQPRKPSQHLLTGFLILRQCASPTISHKKPKNPESEPESAPLTANAMTGWSSPETATMRETKPRSRHTCPCRDK